MKSSVNYVLIQIAVFFVTFFYFFLTQETFSYLDVMTNVFIVTLILILDIWFEYYIDIQNLENKYYILNKFIEDDAKGDPEFDLSYLNHIMKTTSEQK